MTATSNASLGASELIVSAIGVADFRKINEAIQASAPGSRIIIMPGIYRECVIVDKSLELIGNGPAASIIVQPISEFMGLHIGINEYVHVQGLTIHSPDQPQADYCPRAVEITNGQVLFEDCIVAHGKASQEASFWVSALESKTGIKSNPHVITRRCHLAGVSVTTGTLGTEAITATATSSASFEDCDVSQGMEVRDTSITRCRIHNSVGAGATLQNSIIDDCDVYDNQLGVWISEGNCAVRNSRIYRNTAGGIETRPSRNGLKSQIERCIITQNARYGILYGGGHTTVANSQITGNMAGVWVGAGGQLTVTHCDLTDNRSGAFHVERGASVMRSDNREHTPLMTRLFGRK